jgi:hypothetical protein
MNAPLTFTNCCLDIVSLAEMEIKMIDLNQRGQIAKQMGSLWRVLLRKEIQFEGDFVRAGGHLMAGVNPTG